MEYDVFKQFLIICSFFRCGCDECITLSQQDSLRQALSRLNEYKALASPSLIALSSSDPILTAFQLSWELRGLAFAEPVYKNIFYSFLPIIFIQFSFSMKRHSEKLNVKSNIEYFPYSLLVYEIEQRQSSYEAKTMSG